MVDDRGQQKQMIRATGGLSLLFWLSQRRDHAPKGGPSVPPPPPPQVWHQM